MSKEIRASEGDFAVAAFQLSRSLMTALIDQKVLSRGDIRRAITTNLEIGDRMPAGAAELLRALERGLAENDR